jgi:hypothetical protein
MRRLRSFAALLAVPVLVSGGCSEAVLPHPENVALPAPDLSLDPDSVVIGAMMAACRPNPAHRASTERVLVDIVFGRRNAADPEDRPLAEHVQAVTARGGTVLHRFNAPAVRARIDLARIPDLVEHEHFVHVLTVPEPRRYDLRVIVGYARALTAADTDRIAALGGRVAREFPALEMLVVELPDRSIPSLRQDRDVRWVEVDGAVCTGVGVG